MGGEQFYTDETWPIPLDPRGQRWGSFANDQNPSCVFLLGRVRHGDRTRGSEPAHLRGMDLKGLRAANRRLLAPAFW
jgi:hypothetical protein